jgi:hypothetical protein
MRRLCQAQRQRIESHIAAATSQIETQRFHAKALHIGDAPTLRCLKSNVVASAPLARQLGIVRVHFSDLLSFKEMQPRRNYTLQEGLGLGNPRLGVFSSQAEHMRRRKLLTSPRTISRQTNSLLSVLIDPGRIMTPPLEAKRHTSALCGATSVCSHKWRLKLAARCAASG